MKPIRFMVALMAIAFSTAAVNTANAQNIRHSNGNRTENRQQMRTGDSHGNKHINANGNRHAPVAKPHDNHGYHGQAHHHDAYHHDHSYLYAHHAHEHYHYDRHHGYVHYYDRPSHIHHMCAEYVPVVGHVVDALPAHHVICEVNGFRFYRALGHIFRPIVIGGIIHFIVE